MASFFFSILTLVKRHEFLSYIYQMCDEMWQAVERKSYHIEKSEANECRLRI
jgi:hypothetical protein